MRYRVWVGVAGIIALLGLVACSGDENAASGIEIKDAYVSSTGSGDAALYFTVVNHGDADTLLSVKTSAAAQAMFHEDVVEGNSTSMQMRASIPIPANGEFTFRPGEFHVMLMNPPQPLQEGDTIEVTATFEQAGEKTFTATVSKPGAELGGQ